MRTRPFALAALAAVLVLAAAACGSGDDDTTAATSTGTMRTVDVEMVDLGFRPTTVRVAKAEKVTFRFTNRGKVPHDAFIGDRDAQMAHEAEMGGDMGDMHHDPGEAAITVDPGTTATLTHTFHEAGTFEVGCHQPGHYAAGMKLAVTVVG